MHSIVLAGCTTTPLGGYLKALAVLRLVSEQKDDEARGFWESDTFHLLSALNEDELIAFLLSQYSPTPILAPWNGGSGFYPKDNKEGIDAIAASSDRRFADYRIAIEQCRRMDELTLHAGQDEDERRMLLLRRCRNTLSDRAVDWLDAAVGIGADGKRSFAPILGTGGNEGRLDYTNNFMARVSELLLSPGIPHKGKELLEAALFGSRTTALQAYAAGQFDPGRAGGANQSAGISGAATTNPWDLILTLEGAVAWASGLYRRQGAGFRSILCSPFTVRPRTVGYGSASNKDDARAEVWTPLWARPVRYAELKSLLREGRASVQGRPAQNSLQFAEAACSLGVDRGIERFVRYSLLKRRGDSYVALPVGTFSVGYRGESDRIREFQGFYENLTGGELPKGTEEAKRNAESAIYQTLLVGGKDRIRDLMAALGRLLRIVLTTTEAKLPAARLSATVWLEACGFESIEVRIAAALSSIWDQHAKSMLSQLTRAGGSFSWIGQSFPQRLISVLSRRLQLAVKNESTVNPVAGRCTIHPGDATLFIEGGVDDKLIEDLLFAFLALDWEHFRSDGYSSAEVLPVYAVLKHLFLPSEIQRGGEPKRLIADPRVLPLLSAGRIDDATDIAVSRLRIAGLAPLQVHYGGGMDPLRLGAALLIPVWPAKLASSKIFHEQNLSLEASA